MKEDIVNFVSFGSRDTSLDVAIDYVLETLGSISDRG
jgi:hypothetical protein